MLPHVAGGLSGWASDRIRTGDAIFTRDPLYR